MLSAVGAAVHQAAGFVAMADDAATAMLAFRSELVDGALKAIKDVGIAGRHNLERKILVISANFALCHLSPPFNYFRSGFAAGTVQKWTARPSTYSVLSGRQSPMSNAWETIRVPGFSARSVGLSLRFTELKR